MNLENMTWQASKSNQRTLDIVELFISGQITRDELVVQIDQIGYDAYSDGYDQCKEDVYNREQENLGKHWLTGKPLHDEEKNLPNIPQINLPAATVDYIDQVYAVQPNLSEHIDNVAKENYLDTKREL